MRPLNMIRQTLMAGASYLGMANGMAAADAVAFRKLADAWIAANPHKAKGLAQAYDRAAAAAGRPNRVLTAQVDLGDYY